MLHSRETQPEDSVVRVGATEIGGASGLALIAGPCSVESLEQALEAAWAVKNAGATLFRGGAFKPRTSPYSFQGLGEEGLRILARVREETGLAIITEALDHEQLALVEQHADAIQIGARNMQNFSLLKRAGRSLLPVLLKRSPSATVGEWLLAAEHVMAEGNRQVILCERGVCSFADHMRGILDLGAVVAAKERSHLPVLADPSHAAGRRELVAPLAMAAAAAGAHGLMIEVHPDPDQALSDGPQSLYPEEFARLAPRLREAFALSRPRSAASEPKRDPSPSNGRLLEPAKAV